MMVCDSQSQVIKDTVTSAWLHLGSLIPPVARTCGNRYTADGNISGVSLYIEQFDNK